MTYKQKVKQTYPRATLNYKWHNRDIYYILPEEAGMVMNPIKGNIGGGATAYEAWKAAYKRIKQKGEVQ